MNNTYTGNSPQRKLKKGLIAGIALAILAAIIIIGSVVVVPAGSTGVVVTLGKVSENVMQEGLHFKLPIVQQVVKISNKIQVIEIDADSVSKDLQQVSSTLAVNYRIGYNDSANIYKNIGNSYESVVLLPAVQESVKSVSAKYTAEELITKRAQVSEEIKIAIDAKVSEYGIIIEEFNLVNFGFSEEFNEAIEAKQVAEQNLITTKTEQEQALVIANAEAEKKIIAAEAQAKAIMTEAQAQAQANELLSDSITDKVIDYQKVQKWDGKLPVATSGNTFLDITSAAEQTPAQ